MPTMAGWFPYSGTTDEWYVSSTPCDGLYNRKPYVCTLDWDPSVRDCT